MTEQPHSGNDSNLAIGPLALALLCGPAALISAIVTTAVILRQRNRHWYQVLIPVAAITIVMWIAVSLAGPSEWRFGSPLVLAWSGPWRMVNGGPILPGLIGGLIGALVGACTGIVGIGFQEHSSGRAEWHPLEQRRREVSTNRVEQKVTKTLSSVSEAEEVCSSPPLGVAEDGDLVEWRESKWCVFPKSARGLGIAIVGGSGTGKTTTAQRVVWAEAKMGKKVFVLDCKGTDPQLPAEILASIQQVNPDAKVALWPRRPIDIWRGDPDAVASRLMEIFDWSEPFYREASSAILRLALSAPDPTGPVTSSYELLRRIDPSYLRQAWRGTRRELDASIVTDDPKAINGFRLRLSGIMASLGEQVDGDWSFDDVDAAVLSTPSLTSRENADAIARVLLADFAHWASSRKNRIGEDAVLVIDEFSAIRGGADLVIHLSERLRDVGCRVVVTAQSWHGLGVDDDERRRLAGAVGVVITQRVTHPDEIVQLAGSVRATEQSWQLDNLGQSGMGTVKMGHKFSLDPDAIRRGKVGEAWIIQHGQWLKTRVAPIEIDPARVKQWESTLIASAKMTEPTIDALAIEPIQAKTQNGGTANSDRRLILAMAAAIRAGRFSDGKAIADAIGAQEEYEALVESFRCKRKAQRRYQR